MNSASPFIASTLRPSLSLLVLGVALASLAVSPGVAAQSLERTVEVQGWSTTGQEFVANLSVRGENGPETTVPGPFSYRLIQAWNADTGEELSAWRGGQAEGAEQPAFTEAGTAQDGRAWLQSHRVETPESGAASPDGHRFVSFVSRSLPAPSSTPECQGCQVCRTSFEVVLFDASAHEARVLDSGARDGARVPAGETPVCPALSVRVWWHATQDRLATVLTETAGVTPFETLTLYAFTGGTSAFPAVPVAAVRHAVMGGTLRAEFDALVASLPDSNDRFGTMTRLAELSLEAGDRRSSRDYLEILQSMGESPANAFRVQMLDWLDGNERAMRNMTRLAVDAGGIVDRELAAALYIAGEYDDAMERLGGPMSLEFARLVLRYDLTFGLRALANVTRDGSSGDDATRQMYIDTLFAAERGGETAPLLQGADLQDPVWFGLALRSLVSQGRHEEVLREGYARIFDEPANCGLWHALGLAEKRAGNLDQAVTLLEGAIACDPDAVDVLWELGSIRWGQLRFAEAGGYGRRFLTTAGPRGGDSLRAERRADADRWANAGSARGVVILDWECSGTLASGRACTGTLANPTEAAIDSLVVSLRALDDEGEMLDGVEVAYVNLAPGATLPFQAALMPLTGIRHPEEVRVLLEAFGADGPQPGGGIVVGAGP